MKSACGIDPGERTSTGACGVDVEHRDADGESGDLAFDGGGWFAGRVEGINDRNTLHGHHRG